MRGRHRSRQPASILSEIKALVVEGVKEINLISQDTTYYGMDLWVEKAGPRQPIDSSRGPTLTALLRDIQRIEGEFWVRLLYTHPAHWSSELIQTIAECDKVARYVDMPLQHIDETMLGRWCPADSRASPLPLIVIVDGDGILRHHAKDDAALCRRALAAELKNDFSAALVLGRVHDCGFGFP
jgi:hypothetical protein